jgi:ABC-type branched-subunit amino acid transport system ATPase component
MKMTNQEEIIETIEEIIATVGTTAVIIEKMANVIVDLKNRVEALETWKDNG